MGETILSVRPPRRATQSPIIVCIKKKKRKKRERAMRRGAQLIPCVTVAKREGAEGQHFVCQDEQMVTNDGKLE